MDVLARSVPARGPVQPDLLLRCRTRLWGQIRLALWIRGSPSERQSHWKMWGGEESPFGLPGQRTTLSPGRESGQGEASWKREDQSVSRFKDLAENQWWFGLRRCWCVSWRQLESEGTGCSAAGWHGLRGAGGQGKRSVKGDGKDFGLSFLQNAVTIY